MIQPFWRSAITNRQISFVLENRIRKLRIYFDFKKMTVISNIPSGIKINAVVLQVYTSSMSCMDDFSKCRKVQLKE